jgi:hypothetical protein
MSDKIVVSVKIGPEVWKQFKLRAVEYGIPVGAYGEVAMIHEMMRRKSDDITVESQKK